LIDIGSSQEPNFNLRRFRPSLIQHLSLTPKKLIWTTVVLNVCCRLSAAISLAERKAGHHSGRSDTDRLFVLSDDTGNFDRNNAFIGDAHPTFRTLRLALAVPQSSFLASHPDWVRHPQAQTRKLKFAIVQADRSKCCASSRRRRRSLSRSSQSPSSGPTARLPDRSAFTEFHCFPESRSANLEVPRYDLSNREFKRGTR